MMVAWHRLTGGQVLIFVRVLCFFFFIDSFELIFFSLMGGYGKR